MGFCARLLFCWRETLTSTLVFIVLREVDPTDCVVDLEVRTYVQYMIYVIYCYLSRPRRFDGVLEHVLRIDRVLRQPMGHLLLVGEAGAGKTVLSRFVSWMNGLGIFQVREEEQKKHDILT